MANERVFISYARRDGAEFAAGLRDRLAEDGHSVWQDLILLRGGVDWWSQIEAAMRSAALQHFVLIVTPGSLASPEVRREIRLARQEGKTVLPVRGPGLDSLASVPRWFGHVYDLAIPEQAAAFHTHLREPSRQGRMPMMAPEPPEDFIQRPREFDSLKARLLDAKGDAVAITAALRGAGGYGKTTLAKALAHDPDIQDAYYDGVLWVELGEKPQDLRSQISDLVTRLSGRPPQLETVGAAASALAEALGERRILIVVDDVWRPQDLRPFLQGGPRTTRLVTTRIDGTVPASAFRQKVDALDADQALLLLATGFDTGEATSLAAEFRALAARLGEWPLMLKLVNGFLRQRAKQYHEPLVASLLGVNRRLDAKGLTAFDPRDEAERTRAVAQTIGISLDLLDKQSQERFGELAVFPEDIDIPLTLVEQLWSVSGGLDDFESQDLVSYLEGLSLLLNVDLSQRTIRLHDTIRQFLRDRIEPKSLFSLNRQLADLLEPASRSADPGSRTYAYTHMLQHFSDAGDQAEVERFLLNPAWVAGKLTALGGALSLVEDYRRFGSSKTHDHLARTLRLCAGILSRDARQLAPQMIGRLTDCGEHELEKFLHQVRSVPQNAWLAPTQSSLTPPGVEAARLEGHRSGVRAVAALGDGRIVSGCDDGTIRIWNAATGEIVHLDGHQGGVTALAVLSDGRIASASRDRTIRSWDVAAGVEVARLEGHKDSVNALAVLPDGRIVSGSADKTIRIWNAALDAEIAILDDLRGPVNVLAVLPDGRFVSGGDDSTLRIWNAATGEVVSFESRQGGVTALAVLPDGRIALGFDRRSVFDRWDTTLCIWSPSAGPSWIDGHQGRVTSLAVLQNGHLISGSGDGTISIWDAAAGIEIARLEGHQGGVIALAVLPGELIVSGSHDNTIRMWDVAAGLEDVRLERHRGAVTALTMLPNRGIVSGFDDSSIYIWDAGAPVETTRLEGHRGVVTVLAALPDGRVVSGSNDGAICIWNAATGDKIGHLSGHQGGVTAVTTLPDGRIVSGSDDSTIRIWRSTIDEFVRLEGHPGGVTALAVLTSGEIVAGCDDSTIRIWNAATGEIVHLDGHQGGVTALAVLHDGRIVSGSYDGTVRIWDAVAGVEIACVYGHQGGVTGLAVLSDGRIASASRDKTIRMWNVASRVELCRLELDYAVTAIVATGNNCCAAGDSGGRLHLLELIEPEPSVTDYGPAF